MAAAIFRPSVWGAISTPACSQRRLNPAFTTFQASPAIDPTRNHITIRAKGASHTIEVNGKPLATFNDAALAKGRLNFWVESSANDVKFSNVRVTK
jgi:hypothetical protein